VSKIYSSPAGFSVNKLRYISLAEHQSHIRLLGEMFSTTITVQTTTTLRPCLHTRYIA